MRHSEKPISRSEYAFLVPGVNFTQFMWIGVLFEGLNPDAGSSVVEKEAECTSCVSSLDSKQATWSFSFFLFDAVNYLNFCYTKMLNFKKHTKRGKDMLQFLFVTICLLGTYIFYGHYIGGAPWKEHGAGNEELIQLLTPWALTSSSLSSISNY